MSENYYTPGVCNLNKPEIAYRQKVGYVALAISAVIIVGLIAFKAYPISALILFPVLFVSILNMAQAKEKFCVMYASSGLYSSSEKYADTTKVSDDSKHTLDKAKARKMNLRALVISVASTILVSIVLTII